MCHFTSPNHTGSPFLPQSSHNLSSRVNKTPTSSFHVCFCLCTWHFCFLQGKPLQLSEESVAIRRLMCSPKTVCSFSPALSPTTSPRCSKTQAQPPMDSPSCYCSSSGFLFSFVLKHTDSCGSLTISSSISFRSHLLNS